MVSKVERTLTVGFDKDVAIFYKSDWILAKKILELIYGAKIVVATDGREFMPEFKEKRREVVE